MRNPQQQGPDRERRSHGRPAGRVGVAVLLGLGVCLGLAGCSSGRDPEKEALAAMKWSYGESAITVEITPDENLNLFNGQPHTLALGVCQTADPDAFLKLLNDPAGIGKLFESGAGGPGIVSFNRYFIEPGKPKVMVLNRAQSAKYVGIIAGYYKLDPPQTARLFKILPEIMTAGWFSKTYTAVPSSVKIRLILGTEQIINSQLIYLDTKGKLVKDGTVQETDTGLISGVTPMDRPQTP